MALVESIDIPLGTVMPDFSLADPSGEVYAREGLCGEKGLLVAFTCNHCPYAIAVWPRVIALAREVEGLGIKTVGINPNIHPDYPRDSAPEMQKKIAEWAIPFPYLIDADQAVAKRYKAQCTPDLYLLDRQFKLVYHGRLDDNWQDEKAVKRRDLKEAMVALASGKAIAQDQKPSMGCSIKWKS